MISRPPNLADEGSALCWHATSRISESAGPPVPCLWQSSPALVSVCSQPRLYTTQHLAMGTQELQLIVNSKFISR